MAMVRYMGWMALARERVMVVVVVVAEVVAPARAAWVEPREGAAKDPGSETVTGSPTMICRFRPGSTCRT